MKNILFASLLGLCFFGHSCADNSKELVERIQQNLDSIDLDRSALTGISKRFNDVQNALGVVPANLKNDAEFGPKFSEVARKADGLTMQFHAMDATFDNAEAQLKKLLNDLNSGEIAADAAQIAYEKIVATQQESKAGMMQMGANFDAFSAEYAKLMASGNAKNEEN